MSLVKGLETERNGYNKEQVDIYIAMFGEKYQQMQDEYAKLLDKNSELTAALDKERAKPQSQSSSTEETAALIQENTKLRQQNSTLTAELEQIKIEAQKMHDHYEKRIRDLEARPTEQPPPAGSENTGAADAEVVGRALIEAQRMALQITENAKLEAGQLLDEAKAELNETISAREQVKNELANIRKLLVELDLFDTPPALQANPNDTLIPEELG